VYALIATHLRHNEISFEFHPDSELPMIPVLTDQIRQVLLNLLMNAVEAMTTGGRLTVSTHLLAGNNEILLKISDTGPGIDPSILPNIFEPFVTDKERGTGLGLTITYDIILKHRGRIQAENNPQGGATFSVWLPVENRIA
jgi:two-component system sensor kinase FixL